MQKIKMYLTKFLLMVEIFVYDDIIDVSSLEQMI